MAIKWIERKKPGKKSTPVEIVDVPPFKDKGSYKGTDTSVCAYKHNGRYYVMVSMSVYILDKFPGLESTSLLRVGIDGDTMYFTTTEDYEKGFYLNKRKNVKRFFVKFTATTREMVDIYCDWLGFYNLEFDEKYQMYCIRRGIQNAQV